MSTELHNHCLNTVMAWNLYDWALEWLSKSFEVRPGPSKLSHPNHGTRIPYVASQFLGHVCGSRFHVSFRLLALLLVSWDLQWVTQDRKSNMKFLGLYPWQPVLYIQVKKWQIKNIVNFRVYMTQKNVQLKTVKKVTSAPYLNTKNYSCDILINTKWNISLLLWVN